jgi:hypothetical protein
MINAFARLVFEICAHVMTQAYDPRDAIASLGGHIDGTPMLCMRHR